jgi:hypothetical protein
MTDGPAAMDATSFDTRHIRSSAPTRDRAFWSYVHADDRAEHGRITRLATLLTEQVVLRSKAPFGVFTDGDGIGWGGAWTQTIGAALTHTTFFIPIITPRYFGSRYCRKEILTFLDLMTRRDQHRFLLPLHYVTVPELDHRGASPDPLIERVKEFQHVDWRAVADEAENSPLHRKAVRDLALRVIELDDTDRYTGVTPPHRTQGEEGHHRTLFTGHRVISAADHRSLGTDLQHLQALVDELDEALDEGPVEPEADKKRSTGFAAHVASAGQLSPAVRGPSREILDLTSTMLERIRAADAAAIGSGAAGPATPTTGGADALNRLIGETDALVSSLNEISTRLAGDCAWSADRQTTVEQLTLAIEQLRATDELLREDRPGLVEGS